MMWFEVSVKFSIMSILINLMVPETYKTSNMEQEKNNTQIKWMLHKYLKS